MTLYKRLLFFIVSFERREKMKKEDWSKMTKAEREATHKKALAKLISTGIVGGPRGTDRHFPTMGKYIAYRKG